VKAKMRRTISSPGNPLTIHTAGNEACMKWE
jgi:hypothetical protein